MSSEIKPIYGLERIKLADSIPLQTPLSVYVFPSTYCNFGCIYCAHSLTPEELALKYDLKRENMSLDTYSKIINQLGDFPQKIKLLSLTGQGESLLNKNIVLMVSIAKEAGVAERIEIITNGQLLTERMSNGLIDAGLDTMRISLQGLSAKKYRDVGGVDIDYDKFIKNIRYFYRHKKNTELFVKIMDVSLNEGDEPLFYKTFEDCSDRMYVEKMLPAYDGVPLTQGMDVGYDRYGREIERRKVCPLPFFMLGVFPNGDVEPCDTIYKPVVLGNINSERLIDIWQGKEIRKFWISQLESNRFENSKCTNCNAPNDVSHPEDILDPYVDELLQCLSK